MGAAGFTAIRQGRAPVREHNMKDIVAEEVFIDRFLATFRLQPVNPSEDELLEPSWPQKTVVQIR